MHRFVILLAAVLSIALASASQAGGKFVIVTISGTSLDDIASPGLPNISRLIEKGAIGIMNARSASRIPGAGVDQIRGQSMAGACASIGAGTRAGVTAEATDARSISEVLDDRSAIELYVTRYNRSPGRAEVVHLGMNQLKFLNSMARYPIEPGSLANELHRHGLKTASIGNSDIPASARREASLIVADSEGIIDYGDVSSRLIRRDPSAPYGIRTDPELLVSEFHRVLPLADLIVVDIGDTGRAASYAGNCVESQGDRLMRQSLENADAIIGRLVESLDLAEDRILIISPNPSPKSVENMDLLVPAVAAGSGVGRGLLSSGSTRTPGIIAVTDVSASALSFFNIEHPFSFVGSEIVVAGGSRESLFHRNNRIIHLIERQMAMEGLAVFLYVWVLLVSLVMIWRRELLGRLGPWAVLVPAALMLAVMWQPMVVDAGLVGSVAAVVGLVVALIAAGWIGLRSPLRSFAWICGITTLTVLIDLACGSNMLRYSIMSYTPVEGARYYGIGNYQMGCAIGAAVIASGFVASFLEGRMVRMYAVAGILLALLAAIGHPSLGADAGGGISVAVAAVVGLVLWSGRKLDRRYVMLTMIAVPVSIGLMVLVDSRHSSGDQSHVGRAMQMIASGGLVEIWSIIERKMAMNLGLLYSSSWGRLLGILTAAMIAVVTVRTGGVLEKLRTVPSMYNAVIVAVVGALAAFLSNDSGVVSAATAFIYVWTAIILIALEPHIYSRK